MIKLKHLLEVEAISFISFAAVVSTVLVIHNNQNKQDFHIINPINQTNNAQADTLQSPTPLPQDDVVSQMSPYGTKKVTLTTKHNANGTKTVTITAEDSSGENQQQVYTTNIGETDTMSIPFNTWSPNDKYFFILKNNAEVMVFNASGAAFPDGETYLDASDAFNQKNTGFTLQEATGWASDTLIIINTTTSDNQKGPSYWFEVPSKAIIRLSTEF